MRKESSNALRNFNHCIPSGVHRSMTQWRYWKWQALHNLPLALLVFALIVALGITAIRLMPQSQIAASRMVLEAPLALNATPRAARSSQDVQHLQVVVHKLLSQPGRAQITDMLDAGQLSRGALDAKINAGRDKPTTLIIEAHADQADTARAFAVTATDFAIDVSNQLQRERVEASLTNLKAMVEKQTLALAQSDQELAILNTPEAKTAELRLTNLDQQAQQIATQLASQAADIAPENPTLLALQRDLSKAKGIYSDRHPKVRLLRSRISQLATLTATSAPDPVPLENRLTAIRSEIAQITATRITRDAAIAARNEAEGRLAQSKDALIEARMSGERSVARLKLIEDATPQTASRQKKQLALFATLTLIAAALAFACVILRIKTDRRLRRPADLTRTLGLTPFATIPHLGPSLA